MNTGGAGRASLGPIRAELRYISMFEWSGVLGGDWQSSGNAATHDGGLLRASYLSAVLPVT